MKNIFKFIIAAAMVCTFAACTEKPYEDDTQKEPQTSLNQNLDFTLEVLSVEAQAAQIKVTHNGKATDTWYGFYTTDMSKSNADLIQAEVETLLASGKVNGLMSKTSATVNLSDLEPQTEYRYVVFGLSSDGEVYGMFKSVKFTTKTGEVEYRKNSAWKVEHQIISRLFGTLYPHTVAVTSTDDNYYFILATTPGDLESVGIKAIAEQSLADYNSYVEKFNAENGTTYTVIDLLYKGSNIEPTYLTAGEWYGLAIGVNPDGELSGLYAVSELITIENKEATPEYSAWVGDWTITGSNGITQNVTFRELIPDVYFAMSGYEGADAEGLDVLVEWDAENGLWYIYNQNIGTFGFNTGDADIWFAGMDPEGNLYLSEVPLCFGGVFEDGTFGALGYSEEWENEDGSKGSYTVDTMLYLAYFPSGQLSYITGTYETGYPKFPMTFTKKAETRSASACKPVNSLDKLDRTYKTFGSIR